jgi:hypothetical protein
MLESFTSPQFTNWTMIIDIENTNFFFKFDEKGILCMAVRGYMVHFHYIGKKGRTTKECPVSRDLFDIVVISARHNLIEIPKLLASKIRE